MPESADRTRCDCGAAVKRIPQTSLAALAVLLALYVAYCSGNRNGARTALANQRDRRDDSTVAILRREVADSQKAFERQRDSTGRVIASLRSRIDTANQNRESLKSSKPSAGGADSPKRRDASAQGPADGGSHGPPPGSCAGASAQCDTLIASLLSGRQQDSLQLLFWKSQVAQRDSLIPKLQAARDDWKHRSERRWFCVGGAGVTVGLNGRGAVGPGLTCGYRI